MRHGYSLRGAAAACAAAGLLSACATGPIVEWTAPSAVANPTKTLDHALDTLEAARASYNRALLEQTSASQRLGNALIVGGAVATGLAVGGAHNDAILGVGLLGGTAYALGGYNIDQRRWLIYQSALESFDCAKRAAEPANMLVTERDALMSALGNAATSLASAELALDLAQSQVESEGNLNKSKAELVVPVKARLKALGLSVAAAKASLSRGQSLLNAVDGTPSLLISAVRDIDNSARRALISTIPDRNAALAAVADVAKGAAGITPGAGTDTKFKDSLEAYNKTKPEAAGVAAKLSPNVAQSIEDAEKKVTTLAADIAVIDNLVARHAEALNKQSLAACNLGELAALSIAPTALTLAATDAPAYVLIRGGKAPYAAQATVGSSLLGLQGPVRNDTHFAVSLGASSTAGKAYQVLVMDSSTPPQTALLTVTQAAETGSAATLPSGPSTPARTFTPASPSPASSAPGATSGTHAPAGPTSAASTPAGTSVSALSKAVDTMGPFTMADTSRISLGGATQVDAAGRLKIVLDCRRPQPATPACFAPKDLREGMKQALAGKVDPAAIDAATLTTRPTGCACAS